VNDGLDRSINDIFKHVRAGRIDDAETLCRRVLKHTPDDVNALGMLFLGIFANPLLALCAAALG